MRNADLSDGLLPSDPVAERLQPKLYVLFPHSHRAVHNLKRQLSTGVEGDVEHTALVVAQTPSAAETAAALATGGPSASCQAASPAAHQLPIGSQALQRACLVLLFNM